MTCALCPDPAECYVTTGKGSTCFCHFCVELWWARLSQPSIFAFYGVAP